MSENANRSLIMSDAASVRRRLADSMGQGILFLITSLSTFAVFFIFYFICKDAFPFFELEGFKQFFTGRAWYPSASPPKFGVLPMFVGTGIVTLGAIVVAVPLGVSAAVCLSDLLPFKSRQIVKPVIEMLAAIPSVAYGFFAVVVFAPLLQEKGGNILSTGAWLILGPISALLVLVLGELILDRFRVLAEKPKVVAAIVYTLLGLLSFFLVKLLIPSLVAFIASLNPSLSSLLGLYIAAWVILVPVFALLVRVLGKLVLKNLHFIIRRPKVAGAVVFSLLGLAAFFFVHHIASGLASITINSGTNALNASIILGIMALPTIVSVSEDALQAAGRELREGSYALGATRAETILKTVIPASISGILAAVILGIMRAIGETMVVLMASGNSPMIPEPWYNVLGPVRTLTATIASDMGEADQMTGSTRYHVLFAMALCLLLISFVMNFASEMIVRRSRKKLGK
ncbi:MAG: phosphate ABC transporter permease subunit PstC [Pontiellaceae bacterium]|nr:phosphate ABC transporter permease subunit PstC [Pontiellaceae bacterium]